MEVGNITIKVNGSNNDKGVKRIARFNTRDSYKSDNGSREKSFQETA